MGEPFGKASGRTFNRMGTHIPDTRWTSLWVASCPSLNRSTEPPSEALKGGLPMAVYATMRLKMSQFEIQHLDSSSSLAFQLSLQQFIQQFRIGLSLRGFHHLSHEEPEELLLSLPIILHLL
jgi:hypothetical protein